ncbi:hypothetical protein JOM56_013400 [Amanita muscaria]
MSSRRVIHRHQPLITLRIPFEVQPLPPPPTITLCKNFQSTLMNSNHRIKLPFIVPMPIASNSSPAKSSHTGNYAVQRSKWQQTGWLLLQMMMLTTTSLTCKTVIVFLVHLNCRKHQLWLLPRFQNLLARQGSGDFNLEETLGPRKFLTRFTKMELEFARLQDYENCWPIRCIIKSKIKEYFRDIKVTRWCRKIIEDTWKAAAGDFVRYAVLEFLGCVDKKDGRQVFSEAPVEFLSTSLADYTEKQLDRTSLYSTSNTELDRLSVGFTLCIHDDEFLTRTLLQKNPVEAKLREEAETLEREAGIAKRCEELGVNNALKTNQGRTTMA